MACRSDNWRFARRLCDHRRETLRVEGDPTKTLDSDPFLKALGTIANVDKKIFAKLLWGQWIETQAYTIEEVIQNGQTFEVVQDNAEGFWERLEDLTKNIEAQAGEDFGLKERLAKARATVEAQRDEDMGI